MVRFTTPAALKAVAADTPAATAIASNNAQCAKDEACRK